jgi:hypothetical protein
MEQGDTVKVVFQNLVTVSARRRAPAHTFTMMTETIPQAGAEPKPQEARVAPEAASEGRTEESAEARTGLGRAAEKDVRTGPLRPLGAAATFAHSDRPAR